MVKTANNCEAQNKTEVELAEFVKNSNSDRGLTAMKGINLQWRDGISDYKKQIYSSLKAYPGTMLLAPSKWLWKIVKKWEMETMHLLKP